jgi:hypothetical protein
MKSLFGNGYNGLSDTLFNGMQGSVYRSVGIDHRSKPGVLKAHQKLTKHSASTVTELCKERVSVSDGSRLWFSSESGKIWRESGGTYTQVYELNVPAGDLLTAQKVGEYNASAHEDTNSDARILSLYEKAMSEKAK